MGKSAEIWLRGYPARCSPLLGMLCAAVLLSGIEQGWRGPTRMATRYLNSSQTYLKSFAALRARESEKYNTRTNSKKTPS